LGENVRAVSGIVSRDVVDRGGERVNQDALVEAINDAIWNSGATYNDVHSNHPFGDWFDAQASVGPDGVKQTSIYGVVRKGKPFYDACWQEYVVGGSKPDLSIAIMKIDPYVKCDGGRCWKQIDGLQVFEASAVPRGLCPGSRLTSANFSAKSDSDVVAPGRAGDKEMTEAQQEKKDPAAPPQTADKEEPKGEPEKAKSAPDAGSTGALEEGMQKLMGMQAEQNARLDRLEASIAALKPAPAPAPPAEKAEAKPEAQAPPPEPEKDSEAKQEPPNQEGKPEDQASDKGEKCGCPKKQMSNKAAELAAANKEARKEAETNGASAQRPEMNLDGNAAKTQKVKAESMEERMRRYAGMSAAELEAEGARMVSATSRTV